MDCPSIVAACCAGFASYWGLALGLTWFTSYLVEGLGYSQTVGGNRRTRGEDLFTESGEALALRRDDAIQRQTGRVEQYVEKLRRERG